mmetsp:Transcript_30947/g.45757  ORF Transcript_30947/g.45757 Transcript_30947/m.45757 type:complete len:330 (+) Transcript_30947:104-1093(+)|eukprot:CAMPEP_0194200568 /NCGR_PEP_ID=MMETSP0156-20130528/1115_1 /TAXON_ID=33649 /ORGANISM="Thalassionema nitzschioides, Strain L26-B" /LENGTH=329 /DNA_ID=CAMNT_0038925577 /DNA_START=104 /DNA_END=1093 /DNA_ORIENTATION=+
MLNTFVISGPKPPLKYANAVAYVLNVIFTFGIGVSGWFGLPTNSELSLKYSTLITPAGWAFSIWSIIFLAQAVFVVLQLLPNSSYSNHVLVEKGIKLYYVGVCLLQICWTIAFSNEIMWLALVFILGILYCLIKIERRQYDLMDDDDEGEGEHDSAANTSMENNTNTTAVDIMTPLKEYMLLRFPFTIHCGWILVASFLNLSVCIVKYGNGGSEGQTFMAASSLLVVLLLAMIYVMQFEWTIPLVISWAAFGIAAELRDPADLILSTFKMEVIDFFKMCSILIGIVVLLGVTFHAWLWYKSGGKHKSTIPSCEPSDSYIAQEDGGGAMA